jgi:hypothetical protein
MLGRDARMESIASFMRQSLPVYLGSRHFSAGRYVSKVPKAIR